MQNTDFLIMQLNCDLVCLPKKQAIGLDKNAQIFTEKQTKMPTLSALLSKLATFYLTIVLMRIKNSFLKFYSCSILFEQVSWRL